MLALVLVASIGAEPERFTVTNRCEPAFTVTNRTPAPALHVSPDGTVNELYPDGTYRPVAGAPKAKPVTAPVVQHPYFAPTFAPICPPGRG